MFSVRVQTERNSNTLAFFVYFKNFPSSPASGPEITRIFFTGRSGSSKLLYNHKTIDLFCIISNKSIQPAFTRDSLIPLSFNSPAIQNSFSFITGTGFFISG